MSNKRIIALTEKTTLEDGDFVAIDNSSGGTKKYKLKKISDLIDVIDIHVDGTALVINTNLQDANEVSY